MGFLGFGKKKDFIDLTEKYRKQQEKLAEMQEDARESNSSYADLTNSQQSSDSKDPSGSTNGFGFFANMASASQGSSSVPANQGSGEASEDLTTPHERRRVLNKKLSTITEKLEDLSNQIYHLQQRVEVIERKSGVGRY